MSDAQLADMIFDRNMMECMLVHVIRSPPVFAIANTELQLEHFDSTETIYTTIWAITRQHYQRYNSLPGKEPLSVGVLAFLSSDPVLGPQVLQEAQEIIDWMWMAYDPDDPGRPFDVPFATDLLKRFLHERVVDVQLRQITSNAAPASLRPPLLEELARVTQSAQHIASLGGDTFVSLVPENFSRPERDKIPTTMPVFDRFLDGGNFRGEVNAMLAPTGVGKTMTAIDIVCSRAYANYEIEQRTPGRGQLSFYISFEEGQELIRPRFWCRGADISKERAEAATSFDSLSRSNTLLDYERTRYQSIMASGLAPPGEYERLRNAKRWMDGFLRFGDFSGSRGPDGTAAPRGHGGIPEIMSYIEREAHNAGRGVDTVIIDWAGSCVRRYLRSKKGDAKQQLSIELMDFIDQVHSQITAKFDCVGWVMHQLAGSVNKKPPAYKFHHSEAEWCASFAVNAWFAFVLGTKDIPTSSAVLHCTKARRAEAQQPIVCHIDGRFGRLSPSHLVVDTVTGRIASRAETARFEDPGPQTSRTANGELL